MNHRCKTRITGVKLWIAVLKLGSLEYNRESPLYNLNHWSTIVNHRYTTRITEVQSWISVVQLESLEYNRESPLYNSNHWNTIVNLCCTTWITGVQSWITVIQLESLKYNRESLLYNLNHRSTIVKSTIVNHCSITVTVKSHLPNRLLFTPSHLHRSNLNAYYNISIQPQLQLRSNASRSVVLPPTPLTKARVKNARSYTSTPTGFLSF